MMLDTPLTPSWCPKCTNYSLLSAVKKALQDLISKGMKKEDFVLVADIGCNGKICDYLDLSAFYGLHGRCIPAAIGIKLGNPALKVIAFGGDGGILNEGLSHFIHACRYDADMTLIIHNNQVLSLTAGQPTATTEIGFKTKTQPEGVSDKPLNPLTLALESGASFVARASALDIDHTAEIIRQAVSHKGFSVVEVVQPCIIFHDNSGFLKKSTYNIQPMPFEKAIAEARKWDYSSKGKVPVGIFFRVERVGSSENLAL